jgi:CxxC motif-containing protein
MTDLICIVCPRGCHLRVDEKNDYMVSGHCCRRGEKYGREELINPVRVITSTVRVTGGSHRRCPVKTDRAIPKVLISDAMQELNGVLLQAPVKLGQVVVPNVCGLDVRFVATRDIAVSDL